MERLAVRSIIVAPPGKLLVNFDLAQAESWIVAYLANEPTMKHVLATGDIHRETGQKALKGWTDEYWDALPKDEVKVARYTGKRYNHASAYRMGAQRAAEVINKDSDKPPFVTVTVAESKVFYEAWHNYYHIRGWWDEIEYQLNKNRTLTTPYGYVRYFFAQWGNELFKEATAFIPQSTVADHLNGAVCDEIGMEGGLVKVDELFVMKGAISIINQSHDSFMFEVDAEIALEVCEQIHKLLLRPLVINGEEFTIPVDCEIGERWGELKEQERKMDELEIKWKLPESQ